MTEKELNAIRARLVAATPGPWTVDDSISSLGYDIDEVPCGVRKAFDRREDADFIAHAPADIAALLAALLGLLEAHPALAWLRQHAQHPPTCGVLRGDGCTCGLNELMGKGE